MKMVLITLVGESQARVGGRFCFMGPQIECKECRLRSVCFNLEQGSMYEITALRDQKHDCMLTEAPAHVVEVVKIPTESAVPRKFAIDGSVITFQIPKCEQLGCDHYWNCHPAGIADGRKCSIVGVGREIPCPAGEKMVSVRMV